MTWAPLPPVLGADGRRGRAVTLTRLGCRGACNDERGTK
jgi:hypothetical protein